MNIQPLGQRNASWASILLGFNTQQPYTIGNYGCLITCLAMTANYYAKKGDTPATINTKLKSVNGFSNGGYYNFGAFSKVYPEIIEKWVGTPDVLTDAQMNQIKSALDKGYPVMIELDFSPATAFPDQHFVLVTAYDKMDENNFTIIDPWDGAIKSLKSYLYGTKKTARQTIMQFFTYEGKVGETQDSECSKKLTEMTANKDAWKESSRAFEKEDVLLKAELTNRKEQVKRLEADIVAKNAIIKALQDKPDTSPELQTRITELEKQVDTLAKEKGALTLENAELTTQLNAEKKEISLTEALSIIGRKITEFVTLNRA